MPGFPGRGPRGLKEEAPCLGARLWPLPLDVSGVALFPRTWPERLRSTDSLSGRRPSNVPDFLGPELRPSPEFVRDDRPVGGYQVFPSEESVLRLERGDWSGRLRSDEPLFEEPLLEDPIFEEPLNKPLDDRARGAASTGWFDRFPLFEAGRDAASTRRSDLAPLFEAPLLAAPSLRRLL